MEKQTNKKLHFFQSIHFKIALVFALLLLITFQIVGAVFVQRLKSENHSNNEWNYPLMSIIR